MEQSFFDKVYQVVERIPEGKVTSYGAIARFIGAAGSSRMVGWAMNKASRNPDIPAHRVVNRNGVLTGKHHFTGSFAMQQLLEEEGVVVEEDRVLLFEKHFWDPSEELEEL